jgi:hypothetical protein
MHNILEANIRLGELQGRSLLLHGKQALQKMAVPPALPLVQMVAKGANAGVSSYSKVECRARASVLTCSSRQSDFFRSGIHSSAMVLAGGLPSMEPHSNYLPMSQPR